MRDGRMSGGMPAPPGWRTRFVAPTDERNPPLRMESENVPIVMTPWELREHIGFLLGETRPHPLLEAVKAVTARFLGACSALLFSAHTSPGRMVKTRPSQYIHT